jgi:2,4-dienoyl-CoA reductase-like NADH-dependent reductase (Old Yellow Enzyme family)
MDVSHSKLFTPFKLGPLFLRNRTIRAAAFEGMCPGNKPSDELLRYHHAVAAGGVGMTTVAYAAVDRSALSFPHQLWLKNEAVLNNAFELVSLARALFKDTDFVNKLQYEDFSRSTCDICNYCIAVMYTHAAACTQNEKNPDPAILKMLKP